MKNARKFGFGLVAAVACSVALLGGCASDEATTCTDGGACADKADGACCKDKAASTGECCKDKAAATTAPAAKN